MTKTEDRLRTMDMDKPSIVSLAVLLLLSIMDPKIRTICWYDTTTFRI